MDKNWHQCKAEEVLESFRSGRDGLTAADAAARLSEHGPNKLVEKRKKSAFMMFLDQFKDLMIIILLAAALVAGFIGELTDTLVIIAIVIANAVIGFIQEFRAEKAMEALKAMASPQTTVIRDGMITKINSQDLVPGDIVALEAGSVVPADIRLIESAMLRADEAALTGESVPVEKLAEVIDEPDLSLGDRLNMAYKGTVVTYGRGLGVVVTTGMKTELGKIATMLQDEEEVKTPLQRRLATFGKKLAVVVLVICALVFGIGLLRGEMPLLMLLTAISLAVAAIPEALPAVITISLALGAKKMVKQNALVRRLPAVETLGSVTYICSDKTGTLTLNRMTVEEIYALGHTYMLMDSPVGEMHHLLSALALSNDAQEDIHGNVVGEPTETALFLGAKHHDYHKRSLQEDFARVAEIPFDSERKCMTTVHKAPDGTFISFTKGAADMLLDKARTQLGPSGVEPIDRERIAAANDEMAGRGLRVLSVAMKKWDTLPQGLSLHEMEENLTFLGLVGVMDPPREEAREAVRVCKTAGIIPVMITGDHPLTARVIARRIGILEDDMEDAVMTGKEIEALSEEAFEKKVDHVRVYARVAPEQKLKIVKALQKKDQFVAMTGDGVNDAPALKRADIGVAMGITGTDVSKEAAHMVLLDDNFATIVKAIKEGRKIYDNIRKFIKYLLTTNAGEIWTLFLAQIIGLPVPLLPVHLLWVNLVTDGLPALALSIEPAEEDVMKRVPRHPKESLFSHGLGLHVLWVGLLMGAIVLGTQAFSIACDCGEWQTMVFTVLCLIQLGHVLAIRSETTSLFKQGLFSNKTLLGAVILCIGLQMAVVYVPVLNKIFHTKPLSLRELAVCIALSSAVFFAVEVEKLIKRSYN
jgi:P-type Ca2+ transporter type 2C